MMVVFRGGEIDCDSGENVDLACEDVRVLFPFDLDVRIG